jgi:hypothetical protein
MEAAMGLSDLGDTKPPVGGQRLEAEVTHSGEQLANFRPMLVHIVED